jgi:hypothetical protein
MPRRERAYLIYPYSIHGTDVVGRFKSSLREKYDLVDPFEVVGVGDSPEIATKDMQLLAYDTDRVVAFLPVEGIQSGIELALALSLGKKITIYIKPDLIGPFINWMRENGAEVILWRRE